MLTMATPLRLTALQSPYLLVGPEERCHVLVLPPPIPLQIQFRRGLFEVENLTLIFCCCFLNYLILLGFGWFESILGQVTSIY